MKKLFEVDGNKSIMYLTDYQVFLVYDYGNKQRTFFDNDGNEIEPPKMKNYKFETDSCYNDPTCCEPLGNGCYSFSTHPIKWDSDGPFGIFGMKDKNGTVIVEEKYWQIRGCFNGLFPVQEIDGNWGCINESGELVVPCIYWEPSHFNKYGLAYGNESLVDMQGNEIAGTEFNIIDYYSEEDRYIPITLAMPEQDVQIEKTGTAEGITTDIYDTKLRRFVVKGIPEDTLKVSFYDGEPEPIIAAAGILDLYDELEIEHGGFIIGKKDQHQDVYDYYR